MEPKLFLAKIVTGETVVFRGYKEESTNVYVVTNDVLVMNLMPTGEGYFTPWLFGCLDKEFRLKEAHFVHVTTNVDSGIEKSYIQATSGLSVASSGDLSSMLRK